MKEEYDTAVRSVTANRKKIKELYHLKEVAFDDSILSEDHKNKGKIFIFLYKECKKDK